MQAGIALFPPPQILIPKRRVVRAGQNLSQQMDAANAAGEYLYLGSGVHTIGQLTKSYAPKIEGAPGAIIQADASYTSGNALLSFTGSIGSSVALSANPARGDWSVSMASTSSFADDDLLLVADESAPYASQSTRKRGQVVPVYDVTSGTVLALQAPIYEAMSSTPFLKKITPLENGFVYGVTFLNEYMKLRHQA